MCLRKNQAGAYDSLIRILALSRVARKPLFSRNFSIFRGRNLYDLESEFAYSSSS
jgi:hypothetical protein